MPSRFTGFQGGLLLIAVGTLMLPACGSDGQVQILGYTSRPTYDNSIRTVRVKILGNETYWRGIEFELTKALIREIEANTPLKVVPGNAPADTELVGRIIAANKNLVTFNQLGEVREAETTLTVAVVWKDLRAGVVGDALIAPLNNPADGPPPAIPVATPPAADKERVLVQSLGSFRPELGESITSARQRMVNGMAQQIRTMMEAPW